MDDNFYKENLSGALWARDEIIAKFQDWWSEEEIKNILKDGRICSPAFLPNIDQMVKKGLVGELEHKEYATILYEQVGEKIPSGKRS